MPFYERGDARILYEEAGSGFPLLVIPGGGLNSTIAGLAASHPFNPLQEFKGEFRVIAYQSEVDGGDSHLALVRGEIEKGDAPVLVRMHSHCLIGDVFGSAGCDCRATLEAAMSAIATEGRGALIYLHQSAKGFSVEKVGDRAAISFHHDRTSASLPESERRIQREIGLGAQILSDLNLRRIRLLTNHPRRLAALEGFDIEVVENVPVALQKV